MALIIPSICPEDAPDGEKDVFRRLRDDPDTRDWIVLHSLDLARHVEKVAGEADFLVLIPESGLLVIEVKSHRRIRVDEKGWHLGSSPGVDQRGPFKQASQALHSVRNYLIDADPSFGSMIVWSAVCFPKVNFDRESSEWHSWQVIDRAKITGAPISRIILGIMSKGTELLLKKGISSGGKPETHATAERCKAASKVLRPRFEVSMSPRAMRRELDSDLLNLTEQQFAALDHASLNPRVIFSGPAGSGKTVLAVESLRRAYRSGAFKRPARFCFNRLLGEHLRERVDKFDRGIPATNFDAWLLKVAGGSATRDERSRQDFFEGRLASLAVDRLLEGAASDFRFDILILDEAQDLLQPHFLDVFDLILEGGIASGRWMMFGDFVGQDIFSRGRVGLESFIEERCPSAARFLLTDNCRNTPSISEYVVQLGGLKPPYSRILRKDDRQDPELVFWKDRDQQIDEVISFIGRCLDNGFREEDIVLISPGAEDCIGRDLALNPEWASRIAPWGQSAGKIGYTTIQKFKGLEAPVVVVADFEKMDSLRQQSLFYIGLSRALHRLGIFLSAELKPYVRSHT